MRFYIQTPIIFSFFETVVKLVQDVKGEVWKWVKMYPLKASVLFLFLPARGCNQTMHNEYSLWSWVIDSIICFYILHKTKFRRERHIWLDAEAMRLWLFHFQNADRDSIQEMKHSSNVQKLTWKTIFAVVNNLLLFLLTAIQMYIFMLSNVESLIIFFKRD